MFQGKRLDRRTDMKKLGGFIKCSTEIRHGWGGRNRKDEDEDMEVIAAAEHRVFSYDVLAAATRNFSPNHRLGDGGFGPVFKGRLRDGRSVVVRRLESMRGQVGWEREFQRVAMKLSSVQHRNVVRLYGYCIHDKERFLVYEFVPNGDLAKILFDRKSGKLEWKMRYEVAFGVARGLLYLHDDAQTAIVHRNLRASNILLDDRWAPLIADFGVYRLCEGDLAHVSPRVGVNGYMAPEFLMHAVLSAKADVFSFGVLLLELVSGRRNSSFRPTDASHSLLEWAWNHFTRGRALEVLDPTIKSSAVDDQVCLLVHVALLCVQSDPKQRPDMRRVFLILSKKPPNLEHPMEPGFPGSRYRVRGREIGRGREGEGMSSSFTTTTSATTSSTLASGSSTSVHSIRNTM